MRASIILFWLQCAAASAAATRRSYPTQDLEDQAAEQIRQLQRRANANIEEGLGPHKNACSKKNFAKRQEWGSLSKTERQDYIKAVECLQKKPPKSDPALVPGARSRYDDFSATHIMLTPHVHFSGLFLGFHRYLTWLYEKALRDECGYQGYQPYWDWTLSWKDPRRSPVFDGSPYSMGSNGKTLNPHPPTNISAFGLNLTIPPGTGGGCIFSGPFTNYTVSLGPIAYEPKGADGGLAYNPRCLTRDISLAWANNTRPTDVVSLITTTPNITSFGTLIEDINGVHAGGHFTMGGLGLDAYASAGDPAFWLHHAQVDRMWTIWQNQDPQTRTKQTWGTETAFNSPPSANVTLDTIVDFGILAPKQIMSDIVSVIKGEFCYEYY